jgi:hypothetical protein
MTTEALAAALQAVGCEPACGDCGADISYHAECGEGNGSLVWEVSTDALTAALAAAGLSIVSTEELEGLRRDLDAEMAGTEDWADFYYVEVPIPLARRLRAALEGAKP